MDSSLFIMSLPRTCAYLVSSGCAVAPAFLARARFIFREVCLFARNFDFSSSRQKIGVLKKTPQEQKKIKHQHKLAQIACDSRVALQWKRRRRTNGACSAGSISRRWWTTCYFAGCWAATGAT
jgi:hypothetical protein